MHTHWPRIAVAQMRPVPGDVRANRDRMIAYINEAREQGVELVVFPELIVSGYMLGDRWEYDEFIEEINRADEEIRRASKGIAVVWGSVVSDSCRIGEDGRLRKYNAALVAQDGSWVRNGMRDGWVPKTNLPKYRVFDDARHFFPADKLAQEQGRRLEELLQPFRLWFGEETFSVGIAICEDLWEDEYAGKPSRIYGAENADLLIDISSSPWTAGKWRARDRMLENRVRDSGTPILYANAVGLQNNVKNLIWFDGDSAFIGADGSFRWRAPQHEEGLFVVNASAEPLAKRKDLGIAEIHAALIGGMRSAFAPFPKVVIGLSGGVDSAVEAALVVEAIGPERVLAINMPTHFNSETTKDNAKECAQNLGIEYIVIEIETLYREHLATLSHGGFSKLKTLTKENIQARIRGASIQAGVAQELGGVFLCNGNKTEIALNYFTLYGDAGGFAGFLGDLWKGQIYELGRYINQRAGRELIPESIFDIVPSAELSADQNVDEGKGDPIYYPYHDKLLLAFTEKRWDPTVILQLAVNGTLEDQLGCESGTIDRYFKVRAAFVANLEWAWRQYSAEFKRAQTPPIFLASRRAFGFDRRDTIGGAYFTEKYEELKRSYLALEAA